MCRLIDATLLSEWAVLVVLRLLHAARNGFPFFTRCPRSSLGEPE